MKRKGRGITLLAKDPKSMPTTAMMLGSNAKTMREGKEGCEKDLKVTRKLNPGGQGRGRRSRCRLLCQQRLNFFYWCGQRVRSRSSRKFSSFPRLSKRRAHLFTDSDERIDELQSKTGA